MTEKEWADRLVQLATGYRESLNHGVAFTQQQIRNSIVAHCQERFEASTNQQKPQYRPVPYDSSRNKESGT